MKIVNDLVKVGLLCNHFKKTFRQAKRGQHRTKHCYGPLNVLFSTWMMFTSLVKIGVAKDMGVGFSTTLSFSKQVECVILKEAPFYTVECWVLEITIRRGFECSFWRTCAWQPAAAGVDHNKYTPNKIMSICGGLTGVVEKSHFWQCTRGNHNRFLIIQNVRKYFLYFLTDPILSVDSFIVIQ